MSADNSYNDKAPLTYAKVASAPPAEAPPPAYVPPIIPPDVMHERASQRPANNMAPVQHQVIQQVPPPSIIYIQQAGYGQMQQPVGLGRHGVPLHEWQVGLCDSCHDCGNWLLSCFCPCVLACKAAQRLDENCLFPFICGVYPLIVRFRSLVGIKQSMCEEAALFCICPTCSTLRLVNEMEERGFNMQRS